MAKQRYVNTKFWDDSWVGTLDPSEKLLFLYLLTNPLTNIAGVYEIQMRRIAYDTGFDQETVKRLLDRFAEADRAHWERGFIVLKNFAKHQNMNPKIASGIRSEIATLPDWLRQKITDSTDSLFIDYDSLLIAYPTPNLPSNDSLSIDYDSLSHSNTNSNTNSNSNFNSNAGQKTRQKNKVMKKSENDFTDIDS